MIYIINNCERELLREVQKWNTKAEKLVLQNEKVIKLYKELIQAEMTQMFVTAAVTTICFGAVILSLNGVLFKPKKENGQRSKKNKKRS